MTLRMLRPARGATALLTAAMLVGGLAACGGPPPAPAGGPTPAPPAGSTPTPSATAHARPAAAHDPLTGGKVSDHPVVAAKIENIAAARPQVGLSQADIVFVEEVEGAQTRLVAVFHSRLPRRLGPVRSARTTDAQLLPLFGKPGLVYSGANPRVQRRLDDASLVPIFRLTRDRRRPAPHNVFVDLARIARTEKPGPARSIGWTFADRPGAGSRPAATVTAKVGHDPFNFEYAKGRYAVTWRGQRYTDGDSGAVTKTDNVVVLRVRNVADGNHDVLGSASVFSRTVGTGKVSVYRDGVRTDGTWSRTRASGPLRLVAAGGQDIALKPGQTWVTLQG